MRKKKNRYKWLNSFSLNALTRFVTHRDGGTIINYPQEATTDYSEYIVHVSNPKSSENLDIYINIKNVWQGLSFQDIVILSAVWSLRDEAKEFTDSKTVGNSLITGLWYQIPVQKIYELITHCRWSDLTTGSDKESGKLKWLMLFRDWCLRIRAVEGAYQFRDKASHKLVVCETEEALLGAYLLNGTKGDFDSWCMSFHVDDNSPIDHIIKLGRQVVVPDEMTSYSSGRTFSWRLAEYYIAFRIRCTSIEKAKMTRKIRLLTLREVCGKVSKSWLCGYMEYLKSKGYIGSWEYCDGADGHKVIKFTQPEKEVEE